MARATLILVAWNSLRDLPDCLASVAAQLTDADEVLVVDNGSTDGSADYVASQYPGIKLVRLVRNSGYAGGVNAGIQVAAGDYLLMLNPDVVLAQDWLSEMVAALADPSVGVAGGKLHFPDGRVQHAGGTIIWPRAVTDHHGYAGSDEGQWEQARDVDYVTGAAWGFRRDVAQVIGPLDEAFWPGYYEEVDYCYRVRKGGLRVVYAPTASAVHKESVSLGRSLRYLSIFHRNRLRFVLKWLSPVALLSHFVPAEKAWLQGGAPPLERQAMARIYKITLLHLTDLLSAGDGRIPQGPDYRELSDAMVALWETATTFRNEQPDS